MRAVVAESALAAGGETPPLCREALEAHGLLGSAHYMHDEAPLPSALLSAARLHAMTEAELWLYEPPREQPTKTVPPASTASEWHALVSLRAALTPPAACRAALSQVDALLAELCHVVPEHSPLRLDASDAAAGALLSASGGRGAVCVAECTVGGRGLVAQAALRVGDAALSLPATALISAATARSELPPAVVSLLEEEDVWSEHLLVMLFLMRERALGARSRWTATLALLPPLDTEGGPPSAWAEKELLSIGGTDAYWQVHAVSFRMYLYLSICLYVLLYVRERVGGGGAWESLGLTLTLNPAATK